MTELPFRKISSQRFGEILMPVIPVTITGMSEKFNIEMLLDSGADISSGDFFICLLFVASTPAGFFHFINTDLLPICSKFIILSNTMI